MSRTRRLSSPARRGAAALVVVMMLFFIISLVAAYASRNLIFEQRTSANNYRATQAFDAAEAGMEWALAMLNGGRIDAACSSSANPADDSFRDRYLAIVDAAGRLDARRWNKAGADVALKSACVRDGDEWRCSCPSSDDPALAAPGGSSATPAFVVEFGPAPNNRPHLASISVQGCSSWGAPCAAGAGNTSDAEAKVFAIVGLAPALTQAPVAAITVRGPLDAPNAEFVNPETTGLAVDAGGDVDAPRIIGPAGMSGASAQQRLVVPGDKSLSEVTPAGGLSRGEMMFLAAFGMPPAAYRVQASVRRIIDCGDDCTAALQDAAARFPGRVLWIDGDLRLAADSVLELGSADAPVLLVVDGNIDWAAGASVVIRGMVHVRGAEWSSAGAAATVIGAVVAEGDAAVGTPDEGRFTITGAPRIVFDVTMVDRLREVRSRSVFDFASFARLPGSWRDFVPQ